MRILHMFEKFMRRIFPSTFTIAIGLTIITFILAILLTSRIDISTSSNPVLSEVSGDPLASSTNHFLQLLGFWYNGLWSTGMLAFAVQMMLILVLGYVLAATRPFKKLIEGALTFCTTTPRAASLVSLLTLALSFFNWGLGLIFGALFARKVAEHAKELKIPLNYPLIGAAGYSGLMVWHGGISGSAPLKVAEKGHLHALTGLKLPAIDFGQTIFSSMNLTISLVLLATIPLLMYWLAKKNPGITEFELTKERPPETEIKGESITGAEKIDHNQSITVLLGLGFIAIAVIKAIQAGTLAVVDPNYLNFILFGLGLLLSNNIASFQKSVLNAMGSAAGILIQFPLYFGIMGIMKYSGLVEIFSGFLMDVSNETTFPIFTFISAGLVNIFVPSGGGQWAVQGPIIVEAAQNLGIPLGKAVMALAYGDQVTNMLQPFWALPLLGITGLKAKEILPYTLFLLITGTLIFIMGLLIF